MNGREQKTDFSGMAAPSQVAYAAVATTEEAIRSGGVAKQANGELKKPFRLEWHHDRVSVKRVIQ